MCTGATRAVLLGFVAFPGRFPFHLFRSIAEKKNECAGVTSAEICMGFPNICLICEQPFISVDKPKAYFCPEHRNLSLYRDANALIRQLNRARKAGVPATLTWSQWSKTIEDFDLWCAYCGRRFYYVMEHFIPIEHGGGTTVDNCIPACSWCNRRKSGRLPEECLLARWKVEKVRAYLAQRREDERGNASHERFLTERTE